MRHLAVLSAVVVLAAGCSGAGAKEASGPAASCAATKTVDDRANGSTVHLCVGQELTVELGSTYWEHVSSSPTSVLAVAGPSSTSASPPGACVAGQGCGVVTTSFDAVGAGSATVSADRTTCGEALRCTGDQGTFTLHVVVG